VEGFGVKLVVGMRLTRDQASRIQARVTPLRGGGDPYASFSYNAHDGVETSDAVAVAMHVRCPAGYFLERASKRCEPCRPGTYLPADGFEEACLECEINTFQDQPGQDACLSCAGGVEYTPGTGAVTCLSCNITDVVDTEAALASFSSDLAIPRIVVHKQCSNRVVLPDDNGVVDGTVLSLLLELPTFPGTTVTRLLTLPSGGALFQAVEDEEGGGYTLGQALADTFQTPPKPVFQFAEAAMATHEATDRPASAAVGPNDAPLDESSSHAWAPFDNNGGLAAIELTYATAVFATGVNIYQNYGQGAVLKIEALDEDTGGWRLIWGDYQNRNQELDFVLKPNVCETLHRTRTLRITLDTFRVEGKNEIDAVELVGVEDRQSFLFPLVEDPSQRLAYMFNFDDAATTLSDQVAFGVQVCEDAEAGEELYTMDVTVSLKRIPPPKKDNTTSAVIFGVIFGSLVASLAALFYRHKKTTQHLAQKECQVLEYPCTGIVLTD
jgi:hypothetical protein